MPAILLTGAAGQGKTQSAISQVKRLLAKQLFPKIWVLLPTELQISTFRRRLLLETGEAAHFGVEFFDFYDLYARLLEIAGEPQRRVKDAARFRILRYVLAALGRDLQHFGAIAEMPGFVTLVGEFIKELKQAQITPEAFAASVQDAKDADLSAIYAGYQAFLRGHNLVDGDGEGWLALARAEDMQPGDLKVDLLIIDGYDQFNLVQAGLLARLAQLVPDCTLTLTFEAERAQTAHRRFAQTRERLLNASPIPIWTEQHLSEGAPSQRQPALEQLSARLFEHQSGTIDATDNDGALTFVEAPSRQREVQHTLRSVKRLLLSGIPPEQIAVVARNLEPYMPYFLESAPAYGIPLAVKRGAPLAENPAVAAILALVDIATNGFQRRAVIDALRSAYLACPDLSTEQVAQLDAISRGRIVVRGRGNWLSAVEAAGYVLSDPDDPDHEPPADQLGPDAAAALLAALDQFFARITPLEAEPDSKKITARDHIRWLEALIGADPMPFDQGESDDNAPAASFAVIVRIRAGQEPELVARDLLALDCLKRVFRDVLSAYELVDAYDPVTWDVFRADLQIAVNHASVNTSRTANRLGRVLLASVFETRGLPHDHVFLMGLAEGEFPARAAESALYTDQERRRFQAQGLPLLSRTEGADEGSLFYEISALAGQSLTLSRPYLDGRGNEWPASPYWRASLALFEAEVQRLPIAGDLLLQDAARPAEVLVALAQDMNTGLSLEASAVHNWLIAQPGIAEAWINALRGRNIETRRGSAQFAHDGYSGHLSTPALIEIVAELLGPDRLWSASQFNEYGVCPYRFFAKRLLALEALEEPAEGFDQMQLGSLMHEILEHTYRQISYQTLTIEVDHLEQAAAILDSVCDEYFPAAPQRHGFRATALWQHEQATLRRKLHGLVAQDFSGGSPAAKLFKENPGPRTSLRQEVRFGWDSQQAVILDGAAGPLRIRGAIDRVDEVDGRAIVIDYKTGSSAIPSAEMQSGRNVQMMLYIHAAQQLLQDKVIIGGAFWHINSGKPSGEIEASAPEIEEAAANLHQRILDGRRGIFVNAPSKRTSEGHCTAYCEFAQLCRVNRVSNHKEIRAE